MPERHVIIGDGIAGATAATTIRKEAPDAEITVITNEPDPLYNRVKIKDYAKGHVEYMKCFMHDLAFYEKSDIQLLLSTTVRHVADERNTIILQDGTELPYDKLLISTGGTPRRLGLEGGDAKGIHTFWTLREAKAIREHAQQSKNGVAIGAGLLGIDIAVVFALNGVKTRYVMRGNRWWREGLSKAGSEIVERGLQDLGVENVFFETPKRFITDNGKLVGLETEAGTHFDCDIAGVAVGLNMNTELVKDSNVKTGEGILTDSYLNTSVPNVWAAGDIAQYYDVIQDRINMNGSWASAIAQGKCVGMNMVGKKTEFVQGLRVTDAETMEIVEMVLAGRANKALVTLLGAAGGSAVGLSGKDAGMLRARRLAGPVDLGFVGEVIEVRPQIIDTISGAGHIPVIASVGVGSGGESLNLNADHAAGALAAALGAGRLIVLTDVPGVMRGDTASLLSTLTAQQARRLIADGTVSRGMIPKVEACLAAIESGVPSAHIIGTETPHALLLELFTEERVGTMITRA